jgi:hypothetical protein
MQLKDIQIGAAYKTKDSFVVALHKGPIELTTSSEAVREVAWRGLRINVGRSWYHSTDDRNRVAVLDIGRQQVQVLSSAAIHRPLTDEAVYELCTQRIVDEETRRMRSQLDEQRAAFLTGLTTMLAELTNTEYEADYAETRNPYLILLRRPDFVRGLLTLWLKYLEAQGKDVGERAPVDILAEFNDLTLGLEQTHRRQQRLTADATQAADERVKKAFNRPLEVVEV